MSVSAAFVLALAIAYLLGSVPTGYLLVRATRREDIREAGSGNIGATNVARHGGTGLGIATLVIDLLKGVLAVTIARKFAGVAGFPAGYDLEALAGLFAVLGHVLPVWLGFRGGKGVATGFGVFLALMPLTALASVLIFAVVFALTRYVSLASITAAVCLAFIAVLTDPRRRVIVDLVYIAIPLLIVLKHHANIQRLLARNEPRFGKAGA